MKNVQRGAAFDRSAALPPTVSKYSDKAIGVADIDYARTSSTGDHDEGYLVADFDGDGSPDKPTRTFRPHR